MPFFANAFVCVYLIMAGSLQNMISYSSLKIAAIFLL
uniref:Uncharacterized protein n=1 Tax=Anguilla anguilla TaxID=7936 RepID=A0A0E9VG13_ANGAN